MNPEGSPQAAWMLLNATCLSSFSRGVFQHFSLLGRGLLSLYFESIGLLKSKSINPLMVFPTHPTDPQVVLSPHAQMERNQVGFVFSLSWVLHRAIRFDFRGTERLKQKTL